MDELRQEAAIVELLVARRPDACRRRWRRPATGWMLMPDAGEQLREVVERERSLDRWLDVLTRYAEVQIDLMDDADALLGAGAPDMRLAVLPRGLRRAARATTATLDPRRPHPARLSTSWSNGWRRSASPRRSSTTTCTTARSS